jgi:chromosome segregation ATPase
MHTNRTHHDLLKSHEGLANAHEQTLGHLKARHDSIYERRHGRAADGKGGPSGAEDVVTRLQEQVAWLLTVADERDALAAQNRQLLEEATALEAENGRLAEDNTILAHEAHASDEVRTGLERQLATVQEEQTEADAYLRQRVTNAETERNGALDDLRGVLYELDKSKEAHHVLADALHNTRESVRPPPSQAPLRLALYCGRLVLRKTDLATACHPPGILRENSNPNKATWGRTVSPINSEDVQEGIKAGSDLG